MAFDDVFQRIIFDSTQLYLSLYILSNDCHHNSPKISQKIAIFAKKYLILSKNESEKERFGYFWAENKGPSRYQPFKCYKIPLAC